MAVGAPAQRAPTMIASYIPVSPSQLSVPSRVRDERTRRIGEFPYFSVRAA
jgi:hypothetical protein